LTSPSPRENGPGPGGRAPFSRYWLPVLAYIALIFGLSSIHGNAIPSPFPYVDKVAHLMEYGLFGLLAGRAIRFTMSGRSALVTAVVTILFGALIGALDENYQRFTPGRDCDLTDWMTDTVAVALSVILTQIVTIRSLRRRRSERPEPPGR